jgi:NAD(P)-dependent dehydrogenase (short-subunit alcohol dehydrogenase family)
MSERLLGKVCIITGTGGSIGRETALTFAREGALVVGCDLQVEAAQSTVEAVRAAAGLNALFGSLRQGGGICRGEAHQPRGAAQ